MFQARKFIRYISVFTAFTLTLTLGMTASASESRKKSFDIYTGPTVYADKKGTTAIDDTVAILDRTNERWSLVRLADGTVGYCKNNLLQINYTESAAETARTKYVTKLLNSPDETAKAASVLPANLQLTVKSEENNEFISVKLKSGKTGYLPSSALEFEPKSTAVIYPIPELTAHTGITTEEAAKERLEELSEYFEAGRYWNTFDADDSLITQKAFIMSDTPCRHKTQGYGQCNFYTSKLSSALGYSYGSQCVGYAGLISDLIFGTEAPITVHGDFERIRVGDHIRLVLWDHSMLVTDVGIDEEGKTCVYVTEVNGDYDSCRIDWGRKFTQRDLRRLGDYIQVHTRYPQTE